MEVDLDRVQQMQLPSSSKQGVHVPLPVHGLCLCVCNQWAYADYSTWAVDWLLILPIGPITEFLSILESRHQFNRDIVTMYVI